MPSLREEFWNALTHGVGAVASLAGGAALVTFAALFRGPREVIAASVFSVTLLLLYVASTLYHAAESPTTKARLRVLDHCAIYLLIAGTYTPFTLLVLHGTLGWTLFGLVWGFALVGVVFKLFCTGRFELLSTLLYIALGWLVVIAWAPLSSALSGVVFSLLLAGGITYTAGTLFYMSRKLRYGHSYWHLCVLGGSLFHFIAVMGVLR